MGNFGKCHFRSDRGFTIWELICILLIILFLFAMLTPSLSKVKRISTRVVCGTNLKGLGTALSVYANDYDDQFPELPGEGVWAKTLGFAYTLEKPLFGEGGAEHLSGRTISASWYLLVREADVSPKSFVCPESNQVVFGSRYYSENLSGLWDFGENPYLHVSYSMHNPYGRFPATGKRGAAFSVAADMSPWFSRGDLLPPGRNGKPPQLIPAYWKNPSSPSSSYGNNEAQVGNSLNHGNGRDSAGPQQNVVFADGHSECVKTSDVGIHHDNIFTFWSGVISPIESGDTPTTAPRSDTVPENDRRIGAYPTSRSPENDAKSEDDSFLAI